MKLTVALLQMLAHGVDVDANRAKGEDFCRRARAAGADLALFPETWSHGYLFADPDDPAAGEAWAASAVGLDDSYVTCFQSLAAELDIAIGLTFLERWPGAPRNTLALIDRRGNIALVYAKVHTCDFAREADMTPGDGFYVCDLDTAQGTVRVGAMICYDREFPESARSLMLQGAELILVSNACELEDNRTGQLRARAFENMVGIALANYAAPQQDGHSVAFDGIAFYPDNSTREMTLIRAGGAEDIYLAEFNLDLLREYRQREIWGNAFRKPRAYGLLADEHVEPPFIRPAARR